MAVAELVLDMFAGMTSAPTLRFSLAGVVCDAYFVLALSVS